jgi:LPXTG-motif cell wall-anchored protein
MSNLVKNLNSYVSKNIAEPVANVFTNMANAVTPNANMNVAPKTGGSTTIYIIFGIFALALLLIGVFYKQIKQAIENMTSGLGSVGPAPSAELVAGPPRDSDPVPAPDANIIEKVLPGKKEVFNVSSNRYAYADAEPLCKALGAELATYDQVKEAWDSGADWCNYGWSKGQLALYPTQESTWKELQDGPEEQKGVCGRPGLNGGYFDNPDLRFGVNCYGVKPAQSAHDAREIASADNRPITPAVIDYEKKVAKYKAESDSIGVLPFNKDKWA